MACFQAQLNSRHLKTFLKSVWACFLTHPRQCTRSIKKSNKCQWGITAWLSNPRSQSAGSQEYQKSASRVADMTMWTKSDTHIENDRNICNILLHIAFKLLIWNMVKHGFMFSPGLRLWLQALHVATWWGLWFWAYPDNDRYDKRQWQMWQGSVPQTQAEYCQ